MYRVTFNRPEKHNALDNETVAGLEEFFRAVANNAKLTIHLRALDGSNAHHKIEACFKAFARALRAATSKDARMARMLPSTKGLL